MTTLIDLKDYLASENIGTFGTDIFLGRLPETPGNAIALYDYAGGPPSFTHDNTTPYQETPRIQVKVRNTDYPTGETKIRDIYNALNQISNNTINNVRYYRAIPLQQPFYLRHDRNENVEFVVNYQINKESN